jgi:hypothetical protein
MRAAAPAALALGALISAAIAQPT